MENLYLDIHPELIFFPVVDFNYETGICEISGESYMEDSFKFYEPVVKWLRQYTSEKKPVIFNIKVTYFNTSSSRFILEILDLLNTYKSEGNSAVVNWYYKKDDPDMLKEINDFIEETGMEITPITF
jgi:hypothetical protein